MLSSVVVEVVVLFISACCVLVSAQRFCSKTPRELENHFFTNCYTLNVEYPCIEAWDAFSGAFSGRDPAAVTASDYQPYFNALPLPPAIQNQALFWSGTLDLVGSVSVLNHSGLVVSSVNALSSAIVDGGVNVSWCGKQGGGIDYTNDCLCSVTQQFQIEFSRVFAKAAKGSVFWLGDGEKRGGAFYVTSTFSKVELPNLNISTVQEVVVLLVHRKGQGESCSDTGNSSIVTLHNLVTERFFKYDCYDIFGQASNSGQISAIADCVGEIVSGIQRGKRPSLHQINCVEE